jgi:hypothetical protein
MTSTMTTIAQSAAVTKTSEGWGPCVLRGIGCNFLGKCGYLHLFGHGCHPPLLSLPPIRCSRMA